MGKMTCSECRELVNLSHHHNSPLQSSRFCCYHQSTVQCKSSEDLFNTSHKCQSSGVKPSQPSKTMLIYSEYENGVLRSGNWKQ